jgi:hypothetical protein
VHCGPGGVSAVAMNARQSRTGAGDQEVESSHDADGDASPQVLMVRGVGDGECRGPCSLLGLLMVALDASTSDKQTHSPS